ncbi:hypothetical protein CN503_05770 [Bacillus cereus]|uniref:hypothetical protein n=1 Tax=Bacillus cereus TaxID=1396 RepID=UPI000BF65BA5|nr:hypothetical protein [Bacillus cereus]PER69650.1 hypothetical protein CN503_05770 [Bacillus cereus]
MTVENTQTNVEAMQGKLMEARQIKNNLTGYMARDFIPQLRESRERINQDKVLSTRGKHEKREKHTLQQEASLLTHIENEHKNYSAVLDEVITAAEDVLLKGVEAPSEREQALFDMDAKKAASGVMFAPTAKAKLVAIQNYAALAERGQAYAQQIHANFTEMAAAAIQGATNPTDKLMLTKALGDINTKLENQTTSSEQKEFAKLLESAKRMRGAHFVNTIVLERALREVSKNTFEYANDRKMYMEKYNDQYQAYLKAHKFGHLIR